MRDFLAGVFRRIKDCLDGQDSRLDHRPIESSFTRLGAGLFFITWVSALSLPFALWPYFLFLPITFAKGMSRLAAAWCLVMIWAWLENPALSGRGFTLLKVLLPVLIGSSSGRFIQKRPARFQAMFLSFIIPFCILAMVQWFERMPAPPVWLSAQERYLLPTRVTAVYQNPNLFAEVLIFLLPIGWVWILGTQQRLFKSIGWVWTALASSALALTFSYGAWVAALFSLVVLTAICSRRSRRVMMLLAVGIGVAVLLLIGSVHGSTADYRWSLWREAWRIFLQHPWGVGPGLVQELLAVSPTPANHIHSLFLQTMAETGLPGLLILCLVLRTIILAILERKDLHSAGIVAALSGLVFYGTVDYIWATPLVTGLFWMGEGMLKDTA
ncbi:MAG TPA: O-antigen ligase family protein [Bacillota bacterium]|nr:O-antigen ligase family protein [Bacillota bacterium]